MIRLIRHAALLGAVSIAAIVTPIMAQSAKRGSAAPEGAWATAVESSDGGHVIGNPKADTRLVEYMSYTCSHCAEFARTGDAAIKLFLVPRGEVSFEIRHMLRDPIDLTAALLTHCGEPAKFPGNHQAIMARHDDWMATARKATQAQRTRWSFGTHSARWRAIASDLGFYEIMEARGYGRAELDRCLSDQGTANTLAETSARDVETLGIPGTPSFVLDGKLLEGVHSWDALKPVLEKLD